MTERDQKGTIHRLSIAPMMEYTDRHYRYMARFFTKRTRLYTEMVVGTTITYNLGDPIIDRALSFDPIEQPLAVQLGGDDPKVMVTAAKVCEDYGYQEINLNVGCPSDRVKKGRFGACLMKEPRHVADLLGAMRDAVNIPVTVKHRIGVDDLDTYEDMHHFVETVSQAGTEVFQIHARKAWLKGLSPAQNRTVPPLRYDDVYRLKKELPHLTIVINGGVQNMDEVAMHLKHVDGVMVGRAAYQNPTMFGEADARFFGDPQREPAEPEALLDTLNTYAHRRMAEGDRISFVLKHLVGLFKGERGARVWRQRITKLIQDSPSSFDLVKLYKEVMAQD